MSKSEFTRYMPVKVTPQMYEAICGVAESEFVVELGGARGEGPSVSHAVRALLGEALEARGVEV